MIERTYEDRPIVSALHTRCPRCGAQALTYDPDPDWEWLPVVWCPKCPWEFPPGTGAVPRHRRTLRHFVWNG